MTTKELDALNAAEDSPDAPSRLRAVVSAAMDSMGLRLCAGCLRLHQSNHVCYTCGADE